VPEGKGADFYANICETLRHGETTHTRRMNTPRCRRRRRHRRRRRRIPSLRPSFSVLSLSFRGRLTARSWRRTSFAEIHGLRISRRWRIEFVCRDLHLNRVGARARARARALTIRSIGGSLCSGTARICSLSLSIPLSLSRCFCSGLFEGRCRGKNT